MADDIDSLLNDADAFIRKEVKKENRQIQDFKNASLDLRRQSSIDRDIDEILDCELIYNEKPNSIKENKFNHIKKENTISSDKKSFSCHPIFISNCLTEEGIGSSVTVRACDMLRCTDCDSSVLQIKHRSWNNDVDYLFLRNNFPEIAKLEKKLDKQTNSKAYCCQCKSYSCQEPIELTRLPSLHWVCGKH